MHRFITLPSLTALLLITSLIIPSTVIALEGAAGGEADGSEYGGGGADTGGSTSGPAGESSSEGSGSDSDSGGYSGDGTSDSPSESGPGPGVGGADAEATNQAAADAATAEGYGMNGDVDVNATAEARMSGTIDSDQVAMTDGTVQSLSAGAAAADAISAAAEVGGYVDTEATHAAYQDSDMTPGTVVGSLTGTIGYPARVARAEINAAATVAARDAAAVSAINNSAATAYAATAKDIAQAYQQAAQSMQQAGVLGLSGKTVSNNTDVSAQVSVSDYQEGMAQTSYSGPKGVSTQGLNQAAQDAYNNLGKYSYNPTATVNGFATGGWQDQNGRVASVDSFSPDVNKNIDSITKNVQGLMQTGNYSATIDAVNKSLSITNLDTGAKVTNNNIGSVAGQQYGQTYSGPKGVTTQGLNSAAQNAAKIRAGFQTNAISYTEAELELAARTMLAESASIKNKNGGINTEALQAVADVIKARVESSFFPNTVTAVVNQPYQFQPILDNVNLNQFSDEDVAMAKAIVKSVFDATAVPVAVTPQKVAHLNFGNTATVLSSPRASAQTKAQSAAMEADPNSRSFYSSTNRGIQHTFGNRGPSDVSYNPDGSSPNQSSNNNTQTNNNNDTSDNDSNDSSPNNDSNDTNDSNDSNDNDSNDQNTNPDRSNNNDRDNSNQEDRDAVQDRTNTTRDNDSVVGSTLDRIRNIFGGFVRGDFRSGNRSNSGERNEMRLCPPYPVSCQSGASILAFSSWIDWFNDKTEAPVEEVQTSQTVVPVLLTVHYQTNQVDVNRMDIVATLDNPAQHYTLEQFETLKKLLNETPILFGKDGEVIYSNGLYSPPVENGEAIGQDVPEYVYTVEYMDINGNVVEIGDKSSILPDNVVSNLVRSVLGNAAPFSTEDIDSVTYRLIDPKSEVNGDEYYDYVITLTDGSVRAITVPQFSSTAYMQKRFEQLGFRGGATEILALATETFEEPDLGLISGLFAFASNTINKFTDTETTDNNVTDLPLLDSTLTVSDVEKIFIYPRTTNIACPKEVEGYETGFMYTAIIKNNVTPEYVTMVSDGRCGHGEPAELVAEAARHLDTTYGIKDATYESVVNKTFFVTEPAEFEREIINVYRPNKTTTTSPVADEPLTEPATTTPEQKPNLTNDVLLETKVIGSNGEILLDWSAVKSINMSADVSLYFRWDGSDYQQCLPFLQDAGTYALTRKDKAMLKGDTESEGFNVPERTASYRVECGGQRNNEFGVDERVVEVTIE